MADKRISQLVERTDIANNDVLPIVASGATTTNKVTISTIQDWMQENLDVGVTSVGLSMPSAFAVSGSPVTTSGNISVTGAGTVSQYIRGDGSLADFPQSSGGGGASVSYYLNGSVSQGTIGGVAYLEMSKSPILGAGTNFTINANGYIASFITDAGDPSLLLIPGGNWNFETYFAASSGGGSPSFYVELYKVNSGGTATLIASNSANPELIAFGTTTTAYFSSLAVPSTTLTLTDRLALRYYVTPSGRTITLHTENSNLCQIITTFTTGLTALNGLTAQVQNFATGTSGSDFNISSSTSTHTFNLPTATSTIRGALSSADWITFNSKQDAGNYVTTDTTQTITGLKTFSGSSLRLAANGTADAVVLRNVSGTTGSDSGATTIGFNGSDNLFVNTQSRGGFILGFNNSVANREYTLPDASGTIALTSNLSAYLPLTGGTLTGALNGTSAVFSGDVQSGTRLIAAASSQSIILTPNSGGTTNRVESVGTLPLALVSAAAITMAAGGTTPQITLATSGAVTLTGALTGTTASFNGSASVPLGLVSSAFSGIEYTRGSTIFGYIGTENSASGGMRYNSVSGNFEHKFYNNSNLSLTLASTGAATFSSSVTANGTFIANTGTGATLRALFSTTNQIELANYNATDGYRELLIAGSPITFYTGTAGGGSVANRMTITAAGNVGIGTASPLTNLTVRGSANSTMSLQYSNDGGGVGYGIHNSSGTELFSIGGGRFVRQDELAISRQGTAVLYINNSNNVGIGTTSPQTTLSIETSGVQNTISPIITSQSSGTTYTGIYSIRDGAGDQRGLIFQNYTANVGLTEKMRITSGGSVLIGHSSATYSEKALIQYAGTSNQGFHINQTGSTAANDKILFSNGNGIVGFIRTDGSATAYNTSSDYRLKEDLQEINGIEKVSALKVYNFKWINSEDRTDGVLAHELAEVLPYAVSGEKDGEMMQGVDYSKIVPILIKAIQELKTEIDSLKTK